MNRQALMKSYASAFSSFIIRSLGDNPGISRIILYGSVAKSSATNESDVDIFIESVGDPKRLRVDADLVLNRFYESKEAIIFKLMGVSNEVSLKVGRLDDWPDLKRSIMSDGIILWGKFEGTKPKASKHSVIFYWNGVGSNRGAFLNHMYGYKSMAKRYEGLVSKVGGTKLGKSCIMVPQKYRDRTIAVMKKYRVNAKSIEVFA
jgi:predicted nucleotidyltransferase